MSGGDRPLTCDGWCNGMNLVTHIGSKGYAYCAECGPKRRSFGSERVRKLRAWELRWMCEGCALPSYTPGPEPKRVIAVLRAVTEAGVKS